MRLMTQLRWTYGARHVIRYRLTHEARSHNAFDDEAKHHPPVPTGRGAFGEVHLARHKADDTLVAVKVLELEGMNDKTRMETRNEVDVLRKLNHPNITRYHEARGYWEQALDRR
jgi:hypothetical protein